MTILLPMLAFLLATAAFYACAVRDPAAYTRDSGLFSPRSLPYTVLLAGAVLACLALTVLPPKGFHDLSLRYLGLETELPRGERLVVGGDLEAGHFLSGAPGAQGAVLSLENRDGALWLRRDDDELKVTVDGEAIEGEIEIFAAEASEDEAAPDGASENRVTLTVEDTRSYTLSRLRSDVRSLERKGVSFALSYDRPIAEPISFPIHEAEAPMGRKAGVLLLTNRRSSSAHDELRLPMPPPAGPVIAKLEKIDGRSDAVLLVTPEDRLLVEVGTVAKVPAGRAQRWAVLQLTDQTILDPSRMRAFLLVLFVPHLLLLLNLLAQRRSPAALAVYLVALFLLSFRLVIGVRSASLYPYHYEAFSLSLAGLILLPLYTVAMVQIGPVAAGIAGVSGRLSHPGGRRQMGAHLGQASGLFELLGLTLLTAALMSFVPTSLGGDRRDPLLIALALIPLFLLLLSVVLRRWVLRRPIVESRVSALFESPSLFAHIVEVEAIGRAPRTPERSDPEKEMRIWGLAAVLGALVSLVLGGFFFFGVLRSTNDALRGLALFGGGLALVGAYRWARTAGHLSWLDRGRVGRFRRWVTSRLKQRETLGHVMRDWWYAPAGRVSVLVLALVVLMIVLGRRETLITEPRVPLMLFYTFLFLAMATANMVFIAKKAGRENIVASLLIIGGTLVPLVLYSTFANDYGSAIAMFVPLLVTLSFALLRARGSLALLAFFFVVLFLGAPGAYLLGGDYLQYRVISVVRGPGGLESEVSRTAQNTLEQSMQMRFYSTAGENWLLGRGYGGSEVSRGLRLTSLNDNVFSVFVLSEMGTMAGAVLTLIFALLFLVVYHRVLWPEPERNPFGRSGSSQRRLSLAQGGMLFGLCLTVVFIAGYMMAANIGLAPLTGKNLPFLGLNSKSDLIQHLVLFGLMVSMLLKGLAAPASAVVTPTLMGVGDRQRLDSLRIIGAVLLLFLGVTAGWTLAQWFNKPDEVIQFTAYNRMLQRLAAETNDFNRRDEAGLTTPGAEPPLKLYRDENGAVQMELMSGVIEDYYPDFRKSRLLTHAKEFNRVQRRGGRSIFRLRRVGRTGNPAFDYELKVDANYMTIVSPFRRQTWRGEILAREQKNVLTLNSLGKQKSLEVAAETYMGAGRTLRIKSLGRQMLIERVDDQRGQSLDFKVNGFHFAKYHPFRPPPKFLVLREDDFVTTPQGVYLVTYDQDRPVSKVKTVNGKLERAFPEGESFYYAYDLSASIGELARLYELDRSQGTVRLTLDADLNRRLYQLIEPLSRKEGRRGGRRRVAVTVMDIQTGDLLALASAPAVDPNLPELARPDYRQILYENHNLRTHPMGSAIKPLFAAAAVHTVPELLDLRVLGVAENATQLLGFPFDVDIASGAGSETLGNYLEKSSNSYHFYLATLALAAPASSGSLTFQETGFDDGYDLFLGRKKLEKTPDFGGRLVREGERTRLEKLDDTPLARSFFELFGVQYSSEVSTYVEPQLWQPFLTRLTALGRESSDRRTLGERMSVEAALPDLSLIAFDRMTDLRRHFLSTTLGGAEGRLHNVRMAEIFARLATGKAVEARLMYPVVEKNVAKKKDGDEPPVWPDFGMDEKARQEIARGLGLAFTGGSGTARPRNDRQRAAMRKLTQRGVRFLGKTGTHVDIEKGDDPVTDSILAAVIGVSEDKTPGSRLGAGLAVAVYVEDTLQHRATQLFYELLPVLGEVLGDRR